MSKDTGGPAFPAPAGVAHITEQGMTLRDYFAAKAMQGIISAWNTGMPPGQLTSEAAYQYADAMIKARNNNE